MEEKLFLRRPEALVIAPGDADALLAAGDGGAALLYLYILRRGGSLDSGQAARELRWSDRDLGLAAGRLRELGLLVPAREELPVPAPAEELPEYRAEDIVRRSREDARFRELVDEVQMALGRKLSSVDLNKLFGIYDELAIPPDVILLLIQYCKEENADRYGPEKRVGFAYIERMAYEWHNQEILTYDQAERWLARQERRRTAVAQLRRDLGIWDRKFTASEEGYLGQWLELGFPAESIVIAADRTVTNTGGLKWKYMDSIIRSWHRMGLHTPQEIEKGDKKPDKRSGGAPAAPVRDDSKTMEQVKRLREKIKNS